MASAPTPAIRGAKKDLIPSTENPVIAKERNNASFNSHDMIVYLDGNEEETKKRRDVGKQDGKKDRNILDLNDEFPLQIANISLQKLFPGNEIHKFHIFSIHIGKLARYLVYKLGMGVTNCFVFIRFTNWFAGLLVCGIY